MRTRFGLHLALAATLVLLSSLATASLALAAETTLTATLTGVQEGENPGDPDGSGMATITLDPETGEVCWNMTASNIDPVTVSHIHTGAAGVSGPVFVNLDVDGFTGTSEGCTTGVPAADINAILGNPADYYVNLHNDAFGAGAIRGQLAAAAAPNTAVGAPSASLLAVMGTLLLIGAATLVGARAFQRR